MSWSENRSGVSIGGDKRKVDEKIHNINAVLRKLSKDEDFQDDLTLPQVQKALKHWTNQARLPANEALQLQEDRRVTYVFQRFQMIQTVCREASIGVPLHLVLKGRDMLPMSLISDIYDANGVYISDGEGEGKVRSNPLAPASKSRTGNNNSNQPLPPPSPDKSTNKEPETTKLAANPPVSLVSALIVALLALLLLYFSAK